MLGESNISATIAVKDLNAGKQFYGDKLDLKQIDENPGGVMYQSGTGRLFVYPSGTAGSGKATCVSWSVGDIEETVKELKTKGISFERYDDLPGVKVEGDLHVIGSTKAAWFKDPDGNILNLASGM